MGWTSSQERENILVAIAVNLVTICNDNNQVINNKKDLYEFYWKYQVPQLMEIGVLEQVILKDVEKPPSRQKSQGK